MGALGIMCSYNSINGVPSCASKDMQTEMLRGQWGFEGYVVGDSDTVKFIHTQHHYTATAAGAVQAALAAGTDLESWCSGGNSLPDYYRDLVPVMLRNGSLSDALVSTALTRLLTLRFRAGLFDSPQNQPFFHIGPRDRGTSAFKSAAIDTARQSMTLLLNRDHTLPLSAGGKVLLTGPYAHYGPKGGTIAEEISAANSGRWDGWWS